MWMSCNEKKKRNYNYWDFQVWKVDLVNFEGVRRWMRSERGKVWKREEKWKIMWNHDQMGPGGQKGWGQWYWFRMAPHPPPESVKRLASKWISFCFSCIVRRRTHTMQIWLSHRFLFPSFPHLPTISHFTVYYDVVIMLHWFPLHFSIRHPANFTDLKSH